MMKVLKWLGIILLAGVLGWTAGMAVHSAYAKGHDDGGMTIKPRGPGGPPVVVPDNPDQEPGPRWKIVVTMEGPPGKEELVYGNKEEGIHWFVSKDECEKAIKSEPKLAQGLKLLHQQATASKMPIEITVACKPDNSI